MLDSSKIVSEVSEVLGKGKKSDEVTEIRHEIEKSLEIDDGTADFEVDGIDYKLIENQDMAETLAIDDMKELLDSEGPEVLNKSFVKQFFYVTDTDKRLMANDEADVYIESAEPEDIATQADYHDQFMKAVDEGDTQTAERLLNSAKEEVHNQVYDDVYQKLEKDPIQFFSELGYSPETAIKDGLLSFDAGEAAKGVVETDGWAHVLSRYDGEYQETPSGMVFFREA